MSMLARGSLSKLVMYLYRRVDGVSADAGDGALATLLLCETPTRSRLSSRGLRAAVDFLARARSG